MPDVAPPAPLGLSGVGVLGRRRDDFGLVVAIGFVGFVGVVQMFGVVQIVGVVQIFGVVLRVLARGAEISVSASLVRS